MAKAQFRTELLERILSQPTAPFRERHVIETAVESIVARVEGSAAELRKRAPRASELYAGFAFRSPVWRDGDLY